MRLDPSSAALMLAALRALSRERPQAMDARVKSRQRPAQRVDRRRRDEVDRVQQPPEANRQQRSDRAHEVGPIDQRQALLALELERLEIERSQRLRARHDGAGAVPDVALAEQWQKRVRRRREIAARRRASRCCGTTGTYPEFSNATRRSHDQRPHPRVAEQQAVGPDGDRAADDVVG